MRKLLLKLFHNWIYPDKTTVEVNETEFQKREKVLQERKKALREAISQHNKEVN